MNRFAKVTALISVLLGSAALVFGIGSSASAHASLESSSPAAGEVVAAPQTVTLTFGEKLMTMEGGEAANQVQVTDAAKARVDNADSKVAGEVLTVSLKSGLADGAYTVTYRVVSEDGHPIEGNYEFTVGDPNIAQTGVGSEDSPMPIDDHIDGENHEDSTHAEASNNGGTAIGIGVAVGAVIIAAITIFVVRRYRD